MMKVLLINPNSRFVNSRTLYKRFLPPVAPLGLAYIAAVLESNGIDVNIVDLFTTKQSEKEILERVKNDCPEIIGFSILTSVVNDVKVLAGKIRKINKEVKIVLGNTHASCFSEQLLKEEYVDIVVRGEGEYPMLEVCKALKAGSSLEQVRGISYSRDNQIFHGLEGTVAENLDDLPYPAFHLLDLDEYRQYPMLSIYNTRFLPISGSRGCPHRCYFCSQDRINNKARYRNIQAVVNEMEYMHHRFQIGYFCFTDAYFPFSELSGLEFCNQIRKRQLEKKIRWCTEARVDKVSKRLLIEMKKSGLHLIMYGVEVGNQQILDRVQKKTTLQQAREALKYTKEAGVLSLGLYVLGLPGETEQTCQETIRFAKELDSDIAKFNLAIPYPGSQFFKDFVKEKEIENPEKYISWYSTFNMDFQQCLPFQGGLDSQSLVRLQRKAMFSYYLRPKVILRSLHKGIISYKNLLFGAYWLFSMIGFNLTERILSFFYRDKSFENER